jgi:hypothetical protein
LLGSCCDHVRATLACAKVNMKMYVLAQDL